MNLMSKKLSGRLKCHQKIFKRCPEEAIILVAYIYNAILRLQYLRSKYKEVKDYHDFKSR